LEPLLFYVLHRASNEITDAKQLSTFKMFLLDEAWLFIKNETIRSYIISAQKTWRKHNAAMVLATHSVKELEESGMLQIVSESCPTKIFLANPEMDRTLYREAFHLNDTELELIAGLVPPGQMLIRKAQSSKKVQLNVDSVSHWTATNNARDNLLKHDYFARFGVAEGLRRLAQDHPFAPIRFKSFSVFSQLLSPSSSPTVP
jgi:type IV secretion system protein VirB4